MNYNILNELKWRGILKQATNEEKILFVEKNKGYVYCGFDPTASSLHLGNLLQLFTLKRCQQFGFKPIVVLGSASGAIGDPSGKSKERILQNYDTTKENTKKIISQINNIFNNFKILDNWKWLSQLSLLDYLRNVGKNFNLGYLLGKETTKNRIDSGLSYTEFSYNIIQAYDFYYLYKNKNCYMQIGGSDQWGNITSGIQYIKTKIGQPSKACGFTTNLLLKKDNQKFGKTSKGTLWLDAKLTKPYDLHQFLLNQADEDIVNLLKYFSFLSQGQINNLIEKHEQKPFLRIMQNQLANELIALIHGKKHLKAIKKINDFLFNKTNINDLNEEDIYVIKNHILNFEISGKESLYDILKNNSIINSKREFKELTSDKALKINNSILTIKDLNKQIKNWSPLYKKYLFIKKGKKSFYLLTKI